MVRPRKLRVARVVFFRVTSTEGAALQALEPRLVVQGLAEREGALQFARRSLAKMLNPPEQILPGLLGIGQLGGIGPRCEFAKRASAFRQRLADGVEVRRIDASNERSGFADGQLDFAVSEAVRLVNVLFNRFCCDCSDPNSASAACRRAAVLDCI